jgi:glutamate synthase (NADPH/NADH)
VLRAKFAGEPEHAINFFFMVAENMREHMAAMGFRNVDDMIGRADMLEVNQDVIKKYPRLAGINLDKILLPAATLRENVAQRCVRKQVTASDVVWCGVVWCGVVWCGLVFV